jgi:hypothetical protein
LLSVYAINTRKNWIKQAVITNSTNPCTVELKVNFRRQNNPLIHQARFMLEDAGLLFKGKPSQSTGTDAVVATDVEKGELVKETLREVTALYQSASNELANSSLLYMFWSLFCLYQCNNKQRSLVVLAECSKRNPNIDEEFVAFRQRKMMNEESNSENTVRL